MLQTGSDMGQIAAAPEASSSTSKLVVEACHVGGGGTAREGELWGGRGVS